MMLKWDRHYHDHDERHVRHDRHVPCIQLSEDGIGQHPACSEKNPERQMLHFKILFVHYPVRYRRDEAYPAEHQYRKAHKQLKSVLCEQIREYPAERSPSRG